MSDAAGEKTFDPTPRRRQQARAEGRVAHSRDLGSAALLLGSLGLLLFAGKTLFEFLANVLRTYLGGSAWRAWSGAPPTSNPATDTWNELVPLVADVLLPIVVGAAVVAVAASLLQTGFLVRPARLVPDISRVNPLAGLRRVFSGGNLAQAAFDGGKVLVVAGVGLAALWGQRDRLAALAGHDLSELVFEIGDLCFWLWLELGGALLALALVDYLVQRWKLERELKMTPQELRDELRELAGHPQVAARRQAQRLRKTEPPTSPA